MAASDVLKKFAPYLILVAVPLAAFSSLWLQPHAMNFDMATYFLPNRYFLGECLRNRIFPWWNPYSGLGIPFHADPQSGAFYPVAWIIGWATGYDFYTINLEYLLHLIIAGWGMYLLMHSFTKSVTASLCIAMCYQLCGVFIGNSEHLTWIISAAWLPWVILYWKRIFDVQNFSSAISLALCFMMMTTGGYPAFTIMAAYIFLITFFIFLFRSFRTKSWKQARKVIIVLFVFAMSFLVIASPYIISFLEALPYFTRASAINNDPAWVFPFSPSASVSFLFPTATLSQIDSYHSDVSMINGYFGLLPIIFLITIFITRQSRKIWIVFLTSSLFLFISFGNEFILWKLIFNYAPLINHIRFPASFRLFAMLGFLLAAGIVMNNVTTYRRTITSSIILLIVIIGSAVLACAKVKNILLPESYSIEGLESFYELSTIANNILVQSLPQMALLILFIVAFILRNKISQPRFHFLLVLFVVADMILSVHLAAPVSAVSEFKTGTLNQKLAAQPRGFPISLNQNLNDVSNEGGGSFAPSYYNVNLFTKQLAYNSYNPFDLKNKDSLDRYKWRDDLLQHPLFYISNNVVPYPTNQSDTLVHLQNGVVLLDDDMVESLEIKRRDSLIADLRIQKFIPGKIILNAHTNEHALLTMLQNYYPGWKATVDGKAVKIFESNISMMSIDLPAGDHEVMFQYDPRIIRLLLEISVTAQFLLIGLLLLKRNRRKITSLFESI
jgi:hypothetical protein